MDDLCGSIIDGRFREQKVSRLREPPFFFTEPSFVQGSFTNVNIFTSVLFILFFYRTVLCLTVVHIFQHFHRRTSFLFFIFFTEQSFFQGSSTNFNIFTSVIFFFWRPPLNLLPNTHTHFMEDINKVLISTFFQPFQLLLCYR